MTRIDIVLIRGRLVVAAAATVIPASAATFLAETDSRAERAATVTLPEKIWVRAEEGMFRQVSAQVPEFGGFFYDSAGNLVTYLTDLATSGHAAAVLQTVLKHSQTSVSLHRNGSVTFRQGSFSFNELAAMRDRMTFPVLSLREVAYTDLDETRNRLVVGVTSDSAVRDVTRVLASLGIAANAVLVESAEPIESSTAPTPRDIPEDDRIVTVSGACTAGFNAAWGRDNAPVMVTASHCSSKTWGSDGTSVFARNVSLSNLVGNEIYDPVPSTCSTVAWTLICRWSDAMIVSNASGVSRGRLTIRTNRGTGTVGSINAKYGVARSTARGLAAGDYLDKVGAASGWTFGRIANTCADVLIAGTTEVRLCSTRVHNMVARAGDSGAPMLVYRGNANRHPAFALAGIEFAHSASYSYASPIANIEADVGSLDTRQ